MLRLAHTTNRICAQSRLEGSHMLKPVGLRVHVSSVSVAILSVWCMYGRWLYIRRHDVGMDGCRELSLWILFVGVDTEVHRKPDAGWRPQVWSASVGGSLVLEPFGAYLTDWPRGWLIYVLPASCLHNDRFNVETTNCRYIHKDQTV